MFAARWRQPGVVVLRPDERPHDVRARRDGGGPDLGRRGGPGQPGELGLSALQESEADREGDGGTHQAEFSTSMSRRGPRNCWRQLSYAIIGPFRAWKPPIPYGIKN